MKKFIIISIIVILLIVGFAYLYKKGSGLKKIEVRGIGMGVKMSNLNDVFSVASQILKNGIKAECTVEIYNFSNVSYKLDSLKIDVLYNEYSISKQLETVSNIVIKPGLNKIFLPVEISTIGIRQLGIDTIDEIIELVSNFYSTGKIGKTVTAKGYIVYAGITININEKVEI